MYNAFVSHLANREMYQRRSTHIGTGIEGQKGQLYKDRAAIEGKVSVDVKHHVYLLT